MAKKKVYPALAPEIKEALITAAAATWQEIASDAQELGVASKAEAIELVVDAGRIVESGKLDKDIYSSLSYEQMEAVLLGASGWY